MPRILTDQTFTRAVVGLYGPPKTGKTWLGLSVPDEGRWAGEILYVAADQGAEEFALGNPRIHVVKPAPEAALKYDPLYEATAIATTKWKEKFPKLSTLIWDTATQTCREELAAIADSGSFSDKHVFIGKPGTDSYIAAPMPGDYGAAQRALMHLLMHLDRQPLNLIVIFHGDLVEPNSSDTGIVVGGPASVGKAAVTAVAGYFNNLFRTEVREKIIPGNPPTRRTEYVVHTQKKGPWMAGIRLKPGQQNTLQEVILPPNDPTSFWKQFDTLTSPQLAEAR